MISHPERDAFLRCATALGQPGEPARVRVRSAGPLHFVLDPYPFSEPSLSFTFPARHVKGKLFESAKELQEAYAASPMEMLSVTVSAA